MKTNDKCKDGKCSPKILPNQQQEPKETIKPLDFKVVKPFIQFGKHFNEVDVSFYNFDIRKDFREYHFKDTKKYEVLPYISASDTILQFTLPYE
ncbi:MAG: hypothetical protein E7Y34_02735, partial [Mycoplasma sp.]|nr:hypothetical protein [Mycoplasma sp.]